MHKEEQIILVDLLDREIGGAEKLLTHERALLHRAFSIFIVDGSRMLLQRRAEKKYHSGGLWTNACCSHPRVGESLEEAIHRRLREEMGFDAQLEEIGSFVYYHPFENGLSEHEYDHVFLGAYHGPCVPNPEEASAVRWVEMEELQDELVRQPRQFTVWFHTAAPMVFRALEKNQGRAGV